MPWDIKPDDSRCAKSKPFGVVKRSNNELEGCHSSRAKAKRQLAALNAGENKEIAMELVDEQEEKGLGAEEKCYDAVEQYTSYVPWGITSFSELDDYRRIEEAADNIRVMINKMSRLISNIFSNDEIPDKSVAVRALTEEFLALVDQEMAVING